MPNNSAQKKPRAIIIQLPDLFLSAPMARQYRDQSEFVFNILYDINLEYL